MAKTPIANSTKPIQASANRLFEVPGFWPKERIGVVELLGRRGSVSFACVCGSATKLLVEACFVDILNGGVAGPLKNGCIVSVGALSLF